MRKAFCYIVTLHALILFCPLTSKAEYKGCEWGNCGAGPDAGVCFVGPYHYFQIDQCQGPTEEEWCAAALKGQESRGWDCISGPKCYCVSPPAGCENAPKRNCSPGYHHNDAWLILGKSKWVPKHNIENFGRPCPEGECCI